MPLFTNVPQLLAATRPQFNAGRPGSPMSPGVGNKDENAGYGDLIGKPLGQGFGAAFAKYFDPEEQRKMAMQTRDLILKMTPEEQAVIYNNPDVQKKLSSYAKWTPEMFVDAGMATSNEGLRGKLAFASDIPLQQSIEAKREETEKTKATTGYVKQEAEKSAKETSWMDPLNQAKVAAEQGNLALTLAHVNTAIDSLKTAAAERLVKIAHAQNLNAGTAEQKRETGEKQRTEPLRAALLQGQGAQARSSAALNDQHVISMQKGYDLAEQKLQLAREKAVINQRETPHNIAALQNWTLTRKQIAQDYQKDMAYNPLGADARLAVRQGQSALSELSTSFDPVSVTTKEGMTIHLPGFLMSPPAMGEINNSIDTIYGVIAKNQGKLDAKTMESLFFTASNLYDKSYGFMKNIAPNLQGDQAAIAATSFSPQVKAELYYIQLAYEMSKGPVSDERIAEFQRQIQGLGGLPTPERPKQSWSSWFTPGMESQENNPMFQEYREGIE